MGIPALRRNNPSVAPASITGTIGTLGNCSATSRSMAPMIAGVRGEGGLGMGAYTVRRAIRSSPASRSSVAATSAAGSPGRIRQFTVARADWGSAFSACPASIMVATQVVRSLEL